MGRVLTEDDYLRIAMEALTGDDLQDEPPGDIVFSLHEREVVRLTMRPDGKFDVVTPPDLPMTEAAKQFLAILQDILPAAWLMHQMPKSTSH